MNRSRLWFALSLLVSVGCGGPKSDLTFVPILGVIQLDGQPLADADISAVPIGATPGVGGASRSNASGEFNMMYARGESGLPPGEYKLAVSLRKFKDGSVPPADDPTPPIDSQATETLAPRYSDINQSILTLTVAATPAPTELKLESAKQR